MAVVYERQIDVPAERERLTKDLAKFEKGLKAAERQLGNEAFMAKAPAHIVEGCGSRRRRRRMLYDKAKARWRLCRRRRQPVTTARTGVGV